MKLHLRLLSSASRTCNNTAVSGRAQDFRCLHPQLSLCTNWYWSFIIHYYSFIIGISTTSFKWFIFSLHILFGIYTYICESRFLATWFRDTCKINFFYWYILGLTPTLSMQISLTGFRATLISDKEYFFYANKRHNDDNHQLDKYIDQIE